MAGRVIEIRFLVPPILAIFFAFLFSPSEFRDLFSPLVGLSKLLIEASITILALGFIISSTVDAIFNWIIRLSPLEELAIWEAMDRTKSDHIREQIHKRWHMVLANFNSIAGILIGAVLPLLFNFHLNNPYGYFYVAFVIVMVGILINNGVRAYLGVRKITNDLKKR